MKSLEIKFDKKRRLGLLVIHDFSIGQPHLPSSLNYKWCSSDSIISIKDIEISFFVMRLLWVCVVSGGSILR